MAARKFITTPTGDRDKESTHRLLPRFRHRHAEPSGLMPLKDELGRPVRVSRVRIAA